MCEVRRVILLYSLICLGCFYFLEEQGIQGYTEECSHLPALLFVHALDGTYFEPQECAEQGRLPLRNSHLGHPNASIEP